MELFKEKSLGIVPADMSDVAAYLAERGLVAVPVNATEEVYAVLHEQSKYNGFSASEFYKTILKAAGEQQ